MPLTSHQFKVFGFIDFISVENSEKFKVLLQ